MSVNKDGVPLFAGAEDLDDMFISTMEEMDKDVESIIKINHPLWEHFVESNLIEYRDSIGTHVPVKLMSKLNSTVKSFSHYDEVDNTPQDALQEAKGNYGFVVGTQMYSYQELIQNSGAEQLVDLVETKTEQLSESMTIFVNDKFMGSQAADGREFDGLGRLMAVNTPFMNIDPAAEGYAYWNPQPGTKNGKPGGAQFALATEMQAGLRKLFRDCELVGRGRPTVLVCGEDLYDSQLAYWENKVQLTLEETHKRAPDAGLTFKTPRGLTVMYDPKLGAKEGWALNTKYGVKVRIHKGTNFKFQPWQMMEKKVAKKRDCLLAISVYTKRRNANGYINFA